MKVIKGLEKSDFIKVGEEFSCISWQFVNQP